jgi:hypothetical protein
VNESRGPLRWTTENSCRDEREGFVKKLKYMVSGATPNPKKQNTNILEKLKAEF